MSDSVMGDGTGPVVRTGSQRRPRYIPVDELGLGSRCTALAPVPYTLGCAMVEGHGERNEHGAAHAALVGENLVAKWNDGDKAVTYDRIKK